MTDPRAVAPEHHVLPCEPLNQLEAALAIVQAVVLANDTNLNPPVVFGREINLNNALTHAARLLAEASDTLEEYAGPPPDFAG